MLLGRAEETATIDALLDSARSGRSGALIIRGEAGIGKTTLLDHAAGAATGFRVLRGTGIESETELPFAGLHLLFAGALEQLDRLPPVQARALRAALGLGEPAGGDRFLVGLAVLTLLAELAGDGPLLCLVDDAHWLDPGSAEALLFAARRLEAEGVVLVLAAREEDFSAPGLPELRLDGLDETAAGQLLDRYAADLPHHLRDRIRRQARGNLLALRELPQVWRDGRSVQLDQAFADQIAGLPERTRTLLLVAAADDSGDQQVVLAAGRRLGCSARDLEPAEERRLLRLAEGGPEFRHPLIRAAAYRGAPLHQRIAAHQALAETYAERDNVCARAWHLAAAADGPDERVAAELERAAELDRALGGYASVAAAYERAAELSPDPGERGRRLLAAAEAAADAGLPERAEASASQAGLHRTDPETRGRIALLRARLAEERNRPMAAHRILLECGEPRMLFWAVESAWAAGDLAAAELAAEQAPEGAPARALARAASGLNHSRPGGIAGGVAAVRELLAEGAADPIRTGLRTAWWHLLLGDHARADELAGTIEKACRERGAIGPLPQALALLARTRAHLGLRHEAVACGTEGLRIAEDTGQEAAVGPLAAVLAWAAAVAGDRERCTELVTLARTPAHGHGTTRARATLPLLELGLGRHEAVLELLPDVLACPNRADFRSAFPDLVEAAARLGRGEQAGEPAAWYAEWAERTGQHWAEAVALRCRALLAADAEAEQHYRDAVALHRMGNGRPFERARTELLYGEWLRRERRPAEARPLLRAALAAFEPIGARPWAERAGAELRAAGERVGPAEQGDVRALLTAQELQVVRLAAGGLSNRDIGAQLFLSPRTVGYHLYKAYPKLGVSSRNELARLELR
ncbi:ATP-binding protein [Amycolatopsis aidingensis]|uniref:ATP-binding protein n=1 Tax=Amycolatopsis aidingensis TaxID=2842453 RepID=UPI001C0E49D8|nr:helix-turn-helix transcriptional regulator [Amycolatopsis aidingensis]